MTYQTEGDAYAAARIANEHRCLAECEHELRDAVEAWYYSQKRLLNIVECNRNLRAAWEAFVDQSDVVRRLGLPMPPVSTCHVCDAKRNSND